MLGEVTSRLWLGAAGAQTSWDLRETGDWMLTHQLLGTCFAGDIHCWRSPPAKAQGLVAGAGSPRAW